ncbi:hypothetical protein GJU39_17615 [Pedobacter petrophilus]|uniref:Uncharacterized protein n=1 Tax=Pedobacter petrophilus TaxID=1908241 RepID=A0A7K0G266_9SPHI|nr:hypothetical protein [Pedobacter petrophilus]MRX77903.1 hypothetical protein [Pedobacter petrophilus]
MKNKIYYLAIIAVLFSCKKEIKQEDQPPMLTTMEKQDSKAAFSKVLAIALEKEPSLRSFIKNEALKQFDMDNDILFQMVKDEPIKDGKTFYQIISQYADSKINLNNAIENLPTLTIMVPEIPNFTPQSWDINTEMPLVAVSPATKVYDNIILYNAKGETTKVPYGLVPGYPVVVVKENERIVINNSNENKISLRNSSFNLSFANKAFNKSVSNLTLKNQLQNSIKPEKTSRLVDLPLANSFPERSIDQAAIDAFNLGLDWHRDYIYYGLNPANNIVRGKFNNSYVEHIVSIKLKDNNYGKISDSDADPKSVDEYSYRPGDRPFPVLWTDGYFDIRISILINSKNGGSSQIEKIFSLKGTDLFDVVYQRDGNTTRNYRVSITPKECFLNEPIVAWDLENYGSQWKFIAKEFDLSQDITLSYTNTTTYATNFQYDVGFGEKVKVGVKFGASLTESTTNSFQVKTTVGSDDLGEGILEFSNPIILRKETVEYTPSRPPRDGSQPPYYKDRYVTNDVSTGSMLISVEPKRIKN